MPFFFSWAFKSEIMVLLKQKKWNNETTAMGSWYSNWSIFEMFLERHNGDSDIWCPFSCIGHEVSVGCADQFQQK